MDSDRYCYDYPRPGVSADVVVFGYFDQELKLLLILRKHDPFKGLWALPGGFMEINETIETCALRELREETAIQQAKLEQLYAFSAINRDPRSRIITIAFWTIINYKIDHIHAGDDAIEAKWFNFKSLPLLAFDHLEIINKAIEKLKTLNKRNLKKICKKFTIQPGRDQQAFYLAFSNCLSQ